MGAVCPGQFRKQDCLLFRLKFKIFPHLNIQQSPLFSQLLKPRPDLLAEVAAAQAGGGTGNGGVEAAQRIAALLAAAAAAAQNTNSDSAKNPGNNGDMKVPPISLPSGLPFTHDLLWRYPNAFLQQPPPSPLETQLKSQLPGGLGHDPRCWNREDVNVFLRYCEREFDLEQIDMEKFQMNGKALCLLSKRDLAERCAGAGDVIHNILQMLQRETYGIPPSSPRPPALMTPTSPAMPLSPHAWPLLSPSVHAAAQGAHGETFPNLSHLISQANSVTLSPAPSLESQNGNGTKSPKVSQAELISSIHQLYPPPSTSANSLSVPPPLNNLNRRSQSASSSHSDSEDSSEQQHLNKSPNGTNGGPLRSPKSMEPMPTPVTSSVKEGETPELNTNGRLLWDFLQQLLNDPQQRYTSYIAWKNKETGVFKIVDPAGLAKLWGIQKNHLSMNYDKMSRALRYYYRVNILRKVQGERHCYQFLRNPSELKSIKNISLLRQQMEAQAAAQKLAAQHVAQAALRGMGHPPGSNQQQQHPVPVGMDMEIKEELYKENHEEPTDLTLNAEDKAALRMRRERMERENCRLASAAGNGNSNGHSEVAGSNPHREREQLEPRHHPVQAPPQFDFRHLLPQVSIKSE